MKQYAVWIGALLVALVANVLMHGPWLGLKVWALAFALPGFFGMWSMMWFNYMQHVHCDPWSEHNHSRNITGRIFNFLVFNNGLHTIHHENPGSHWSKAYALHAEIADKIDPRLNERSFCWWVFRAYVITAFFPSLETKQVGRAAYDPPADGVGAGPKTHMREKGPLIDSVDALEAGNNAQMA